MVSKTHLLPLKVFDNGICWHIPSVKVKNVFNKRPVVRSKISYLTEVRVEGQVLFSFLTISCSPYKYFLESGIWYKSPHQIPCYLWAWMYHFSPNTQLALGSLIKTILRWIIECICSLQSIFVNISWIQIKIYLERLLK